MGMAENRLAFSGSYEMYQEILHGVADIKVPMRAELIYHPYGITPPILSSDENEYSEYTDRCLKHEPLISPFTSLILEYDPKKDAFLPREKLSSHLYKLPRTQLIYATRSIIGGGRKAVIEVHSNPRVDHQRAWEMTLEMDRGLCLADYLLTSGEICIEKDVNGYAIARIVFGPTTRLNLDHVSPEIEPGLTVWFEQLRQKAIGQLTIETPETETRTRAEPYSPDGSA